MDMQLPPRIASASPGIVEPIYLHLSVTDPETIAALSESSEGRDRQGLTLTALKIGILSLKAARGSVDGAAIRQEGVPKLQPRPQQPSSTPWPFDCRLITSSVRPHAAIATEPTKSPKAKKPKPPGKRGHPPSLERPRQNRPWRQHDSG